MGFQGASFDISCIEGLAWDSIVAFSLSQILSLEVKIIDSHQGYLEAIEDLPRVVPVGTLLGSCFDASFHSTEKHWKLRILLVLRISSLVV